MWPSLGAMAMRGGRSASRGIGYARGGYGRGSHGRGGHGRGGGRHPSHLKGKEIGLFYRNKGLQKKRQLEKADVRS